MNSKKKMKKLKSIYCKGMYQAYKAVFNLLIFLLMGLQKASRTLVRIKRLNFKY